MSINAIGSVGTDNSAIALQQILQMSSEKSLDLAEKLIKVNTQLVIHETQLDTIGQVINILV